MVQQTISIPEKDISLFLELVKKFKWKIESKQEEPTEFVLSAEQRTILKQRAEIPFDACISKEDFFKFADEL